MPVKSRESAIGFHKRLMVGAAVLGIAAVFGVGWLARAGAPSTPPQASNGTFDDQIRANAQTALVAGQKTFRFDTFGDEAFWGDALHLHLAIEGAALGGVGGGLSPKAALGLGLKVDVNALPPQIIAGLQQGAINLNDPAVTVALLQLNAVVGVQGVFKGNQLQSVGITCALCHSTVDNSLTFGVGRRLDG